MSGRMSGRVTHPRLAPRRGVRSWWARAWLRAVEEAAYSDAELKPGRAHARAGEVGGITVGAGSLLAAVRDGDDAWTVEVAVPVLADDDRRALLDVVAAASGRLAALLAGDLPHDLVEHAEEAGVELLPYGGELACTCTCGHYVDPCRHAVAVLVAAGWLVDDDPLVLFALRGLDRASLLSALAPPPPPPAGEATDDTSGEAVAGLADDVELAVDGALRAQQLIAGFGSAAGSDGHDDAAEGDGDPGGARSA